MKNIYIRPTLLVVRISNESLLASESGGQIESGMAKKNDFSSWDCGFTDDSFDYTAWPKSKSPWDD